MTWELRQGTQRGGRSRPSSSTWRSVIVQLVFEARSAVWMLSESAALVLSQMFNSAPLKPAMMPAIMKSETRSENLKQQQVCFKRRGLGPAGGQSSQCG